MIQRAKPAVVYLLIGHPMPERWKVMTQKKRDILLLQAEAATEASTKGRIGARN
jgi:hypothetical protein